MLSLESHNAPHCVFLALSAAARKLGDTESRHPLSCRGGNGSLCTESNWHQTVYLQYWRRDAILARYISLCSGVT